MQHNIKFTNFLSSIKTDTNSQLLESIEKAYQILTESSYYDSAEGEIISKDRAYNELKKHSVEDDWEEFLIEVGDKEEYNAQEVLNWLGY